MKQLEQEQGRKAELKASRPAGRQAGFLPGRLSGFLACSSPVGLPACRLSTLVLLATFHTQANAASLLSTNLPATSPALPDASFSVIRVFGALTLVVGLFLAGVWLFKNWQRIALQRGRPTQLQILEMKALGHKHALYVVGYQQQRMLLASSPAGIALVSHLPAEEVRSEREEGSGDGSDFVKVLQQAVQAKG